MAYLARFGNVFGYVPARMGRALFVAPSTPYTIDGRSYDASDGNDGQSPERALATVARGVALATNAGDTVVLLEGTHTVTATVRMQTAGVALVGVADAYGIAEATGRNANYRSILTATGTSVPTLSLEANSIEVGFLTIRPTTGYSAIIFRNANPDNLHIHDCFIDMSTPVGSLGTCGIDFGYRNDQAAATGNGFAKQGNTTTLATAYIERVSIRGAAGQGRGVDLATAHAYFRDCWFHNGWGLWASPFVVATLGQGVVDGCTWTTVGTMGTCIDGGLAGTVTDKVRVQYCAFPRTAALTDLAPVQNFTANVADIVESYQAGSGTAITATN